jgi:hypothetical protein
MRKLVLAALLLPALLAGAARPGDRVSLRRGPCFGNCPVYEVVLRGDGSASYAGGAYAPREGHFEGRVDPAAVDALIARLDEAGFWQMEADRQVAVQDLPRVSLTAERRGRRHSVHTNLPPRELESIQAAIDSVAASVDWVPEQARRGRAVTR